MKNLFFLLLGITSSMLAMELPKESQAIGLASSLAGTYCLFKAAKTEFELRTQTLGHNEYKSMCFKRDLYLGAGASLKLSSILILHPHVAKCYNPKQSWKAIEASSASIACGIMYLEQAYKDHRVHWTRYGRDLNLMYGVNFLALGGLSMYLCCNEDI